MGEELSPARIVAEGPRPKEDFVSHVKASAFTAAATLCLTPLFPHCPKLQFPHLDQAVWPCAAGSM